MEIRVPQGAVPAPQLQADPAFDRDKFLLRQQLMRISEKYDVADEQGRKIVFVERPAHLLRNLGALLAGVIAMFVVSAALVTLAERFPAASAPREGLALLGAVLGVVALLVVAIALSKKRHITFYRDSTKRQRLLDVLQDKKFQPITRTYTVRDAQGRPLARFAKNWLYNVFRRRWYVFAPDGRLAYVAKEDSIILSLLRRLLGSFFGLLRTNFLILTPGTDDVVGEFQRKFTILDRYVLDMSPDPQRLVDRRIALALGVMLDTGERR
jgi:uncharacterized protein YxjI